MSQNLSPIPLETPIVDPRRGTINEFFRLRWQELIDGFGRVATRALTSQVAKTAAIGTTTLFTTVAAGNYRFSVSLMKTIADGVSSSLTVTMSWTSRGIATTKTFPAFTTDTVGANDSNVWTFYADGAVGVTYSIAYASATPNKMQYAADLALELLV